MNENCNVQLIKAMRSKDHNAIKILVNCCSSFDLHDYDLLISYVSKCEDINIINLLINKNYINFYSFYNDNETPLIKACRSNYNINSNVMKLFLFIDYKHHCNIINYINHQSKKLSNCFILLFGEAKI